MLAGCKAWPEEFATRYREEGCWQGETFGALLRACGGTWGSDCHRERQSAYKLCRAGQPGGPLGAIS